MSDNGVPWFLSIEPDDEKERADFHLLKNRIAIAEARAALAEALARTTDAQLERTKAMIELQKFKTEG